MNDIGTAELRDIPPADAIDVLGNLAQEILATNTDRMAGLEGSWYPIYITEPKETIHDLHDALESVRLFATQFHGVHPSILDAGSGMGMVGYTAQYSGFSRAYNIEFNPEIFKRAELYKKRLMGQGLAVLERTQNIYGSYYLPESLRQIKAQWIQTYNLSSNEEEVTLEQKMFALGTLRISLKNEETHQPRSLEEIVRSFDRVYPQIDTLNESGLVKDGKLTVPIVYNFGSDPFYFYDSGFINQMAELLPENGLFVFHPNSQTEQMRKRLLELSFIEEPTIEKGKVDLLVFRKAGNK